MPSTIREARITKPKLKAKARTTRRNQLKSPVSGQENADANAGERLNKKNNGTSVLVCAGTETRHWIGVSVHVQRAPTNHPTRRFQTVLLPATITQTISFRW